MKYIYSVLLYIALSVSAFAEMQNAKIFYPLHLNAEIPPWQDYSKLRFYIYRETSDKMLIAIAADGRRLYDVRLEITANGKIVVPYQLIVNELKHLGMTLVEIHISANNEDLNSAKITRFSAITK